VLGSARLALATDPPFREYHFIDKDPGRVEQLRRYAGDRPNVHVYEGDCNNILAREVFPRAKYEDRRRALCLLDPYNIGLSWNVVSGAGKTRSIETFVNFMVMDMNMKILLRDPARATDQQIARMDRFWGDGSWREVAYEVNRQLSLFDTDKLVKVENANQAISGAYRKRLKSVAGFQHVLEEHFRRIGVRELPNKRPGPRPCSPGRSRNVEPP
jgi:three-Cys-motif partner protein